MFEFERGSISLSRQRGRDWPNWRSGCRGSSCSISRSKGFGAQNGADPCLPSPLMNPQSKSTQTLPWSMSIKHKNTRSIFPQPPPPFSSALRIPHLAPQPHGLAPSQAMPTSHSLTLSPSGAPTVPGSNRHLGDEPSFDRSSGDPWEDAERQIQGEEAASGHVPRTSPSRRLRCLSPPHLVHSLLSTPTTHTQARARSLTPDLLFQPLLAPRDTWADPPNHPRRSDKCCQR